LFFKDFILPKILAIKEYLLDCMINGRQPDINWVGGRPFIPPVGVHYWMTN
jgi:hypothetical protein